MSNNFWHKRNCTETITQCINKQMDFLSTYFLRSLMCLTICGENLLQYMNTWVATELTLNTCKWECCHIAWVAEESANSRKHFPFSCTVHNIAFSASFLYAELCNPLNSILFRDLGLTWCKSLWFHFFQWNCPTLCVNGILTDNIY